MKFTKTENAFVVIETPGGSVTVNPNNITTIRETCAGECVIYSSDGSALVMFDNVELLELSNILNITIDRRASFSQRLTD